MLRGLSGATRLVPIVGDPVAQVKSPAGVTRAFAELGHDVVCVPVHVAPADLPAFMAAAHVMRNCEGVIVTVPHKIATFRLCDSASPRAAFLGAVNTIRRSPDGSLHGDMLDGLGFVAACKDNGCDFAGRRALLVGAGGAGTAIAHAMVESGVAELKICDIDEQRRRDLVARLADAGYPVIAAGNDPAGCDIVVNATPLGMRDGDRLPVPPERIESGMFVGDVVTSPEITPLIAAARQRGCRTSNGAAMFEKVRDLMVEFLLAGPDR